MWLLFQLLNPVWKFRVDFDETKRDFERAPVTVKRSLELIAALLSVFKAHRLFAGVDCFF
jgi:hypothetical protein